MTTDPELVASYLETVREDARELVRALVEVIDTAGVDFDVRLTYGMVVYTLDQRWRDWVVAIGVSKRVVNLRFLHGVELADPAGRLRSGSSTLMTIDVAGPADIDRALLAGYVRDAAAIHGASGGP